MHPEEINFEEKIGPIEYRKSDYKPPNGYPVLVFENGSPTHISTESGDLEVKASRVETSAQQFLAHSVERHPNGEIKAIKFENEEAARFFGEVSSSYRSNAITSMIRAFETEMDLEQTEKPGAQPNSTEMAYRRILRDKLLDEIKRGKEFTNAHITPRDAVRTVNNEFTSIKEEYFPPKRKRSNLGTISYDKEDWYAKETEEVLEWVESLQKSGVKIAIQETEIATKKRPFIIRRIILGNVKTTPEEGYLVEEEMARTALMAELRLKLEIPREVTVYDTILMEQTTPNGNQFSRLQDFIGTKAYQYGRCIVLDESTRKIVDKTKTESETTLVETHPEISGRRIRATVRHETAHLLDPHKYAATTPQKEGFARSIELNFDFDRSALWLRKFSDYGREVTPGMLYKILSSEPQGVTTVETYDVSATFFCWLQNNIGSENFMNFYGVLTGGYFESRKTGFKKIKDEEDMRGAKLYFKGNVLHCLKGLQKKYADKWDGPEALMDAYLQDVNRGIKKPRE